MKERERPTPEQMTESKTEKDYYEALPGDEQEVVKTRANELLSENDGMREIDAMSQATKEHMEKNKTEEVED